MIWESFCHQCKNPHHSPKVLPLPPEWSTDEGLTTEVSEPGKDTATMTTGRSPPP